MAVVALGLVVCHKYVHTAALVKKLALLALRAYPALPPP